MFWNLLLAHFIGDFLLQTDWMVKNRGKFWVLSLHSGIHLVLMLLLVGKTRTEIWPYIIFVTLLHLTQDFLKIFLIKKHATWTSVAYLIDQALHITLIWAISSYLLVGSGTNILDQGSAWVMIAISYVFVTYVWYISERTLFQSDLDFHSRITDSKYSRMLIRGGYISIFLLIRNLALPGLALALPGAQTDSPYRQRELFIDLVISIIMMVFLFWALD